MDEARFDDDPRCDVKWSLNCDNKGLFTDDGAPEWFCAHCYALCVRCRTSEWSETIDTLRVCATCAEAIKVRKAKEAELIAASLDTVPASSVYRVALNLLAYSLFLQHARSRESTTESRRLAAERIAEACEWVAGVIREALTRTARPQTAPEPQPATPVETARPA